MRESECHLCTIVINAIDTPEMTTAHMEWFCSPACVKAYEQTISGQLEILGKTLALLWSQIQRAAKRDFEAVVKLFKGDK